jgi:hypothetical protein
LEVFNEGIDDAWRCNHSSLFQQPSFRSGHTQGVNYKRATESVIAHFAMKEGKPYLFWVDQVGGLKSLKP